MYNIFEALLREATEQLNGWVVDLAERTVINALETCKVDHNKTFIECALRSTFYSLLLIIFEYESGIRESFTSAIVQVSSIVMDVAKIAKEIVTDMAVLALFSKFAVEIVKSEVAASAKKYVVIAPQSPPPPRSD